MAVKASLIAFYLLLENNVVVREILRSRNNCHLDKPGEDTHPGEGHGVLDVGDPVLHPVHQQHLQTLPDVPRLVLQPRSLVLPIIFRQVVRAEVFLSLESVCKWMIACQSWLMMPLSCPPHPERASP